MTSDREPASDEVLESLIENSGGHWREDTFRIEGADLMALLRSVAALAAASPAPTPTDLGAAIYVASRASLPERPAMWRDLRASGWPINSTWIDEAGPEETKSFPELWTRIGAEVSSACGVILYVQPEDFPLKGALIEVGMALGMGKRIAVVAPGMVIELPHVRPIGSWVRHPLVKLCDTLDDARAWVCATPARAVLAAAPPTPPEAMSGQVLAMVEQALVAAQYYAGKQRGALFTAHWDTELGRVEPADVLAEDDAQLETVESALAALRSLYASLPPAEPVRMLTDEEIGDCECSNEAQTGRAVIRKFMEVNAGRSIPPAAPKETTK